MCFSLPICKTEEFTHSSHYNQGNDCNMKGYNSIQNVTTIRKMDMNLKFEAIAVNLTHRTHEAKHTDEEKKPKRHVWLLTPQYREWRISHITLEILRVYALRMLQEIIDEYKEAKDAKRKWSLLADKFSLLSATWALLGALGTETEGTTSKHTSIKVSQKSVFLITAELVQTTHQTFVISCQIKTKAGKLITWDQKISFSAYGFSFRVGLKLLLKTIVDKNRTFGDEKGERYGVYRKKCWLDFLCKVEQPWSLNSWHHSIDAKATWRFTVY